MEMNVYAAKYLAAAFTMAVGTIGPAFGQGMVGAKTCENFGKYPESQGRLQTMMMIALGFIESGLVYCFVIAMIILFAV